MKVCKGTAFVMAFVAVCGVFVVMTGVAFAAGDFGLIPVGAVLTALCSVTGGYIGLQVADNGVRGKCWNKDMYEAENGVEGISGQV
jgi:hypothetical protein